MTAEPSAWSAYVSAVMRIEAPGGVFWVRPAPPASATGGTRIRQAADLGTITSKLYGRWGWKCIPPLVLGWVALWPVGLAWLALSLAGAYRDRDRS